MNNKSIGEFIAELRKEKGLTQRELAEILNVSDKTVSHWECGENSPDLSVIPILADHFGVSCDELLKGERKAKNNNFEKDTVTPSYSSAVTEGSVIYVKNKKEKTVEKAYSNHKIFCTVAVFVSFFSLILLTGIILFLEYMTGFSLIYEAIVVSVVFSLALCLLITFISKQNFNTVLKSSDIEISEGKKLKRKANLFCLFPLVYTAAVLFIIILIIMPSGSAVMTENATMTVPSSVEPDASLTAVFTDNAVSTDQIR